MICVCASCMLALVLASDVTSYDSGHVRRESRAIERDTNILVVPVTHQQFYVDVTYRLAEQFISKIPYIICFTVLVTCEPVMVACMT